MKTEEPYVRLTFYKFQTNNVVIYSVALMCGAHCAVMWPNDKYHNWQSND